jgi:ribosomal protein L16 Arg81 hydroxylase
MFAALIDPLTVDEFVESYWEKRLLYLDGKRRRSFDEIVSMRDIDDFLSRTDIRHPSLRLVQNGKEIPLPEYTRELKLGAHVSHDLIDNEAMFHHFSSGATIVLQFLQHNIPRFGRFTNSLEREFNCNVHGSCFVTPRGSQGFTSHYDTYSFFVLQIEGTKLWKIYSRTTLAPIREDRITDEPWIEKDATEEILLKPGDFLYVPRGLYHAAETNESASIHMTLGFFVPTWIDIIKAALVRCYQSESLRRAPQFPNGTLEDSEIRQIMSFLSENLDLKAGLTSLNDEYFSRRVDGRRNRLADLANAAEMTPKTVVGLQEDLLFLTEQRGDHLILSFADKEIELPAAAKRTVEFLTTERALPIECIDDSNAPSSRLELVKLLVTEGFLTIQAQPKS